MYTQSFATANLNTDPLTPIAVILSDPSPTHQWAPLDSSSSVIWKAEKRQKNVFSCYVGD